MTRLLFALVFAWFVLHGTDSVLAEDLLVFATTSTTEAMTLATQKFTGDTRLPVALLFAAPGVLAKRVEDGEKPDILVLDGKSWMDRLAARKAIVAGTRRPMFSNRLVLITHRDFPHTLQIAEDSPIRDLLGDGKLAIADPSVDPAGELARAGLHSLNILAGLEEKLHLAPDERAALRLVDRGTDEAGIVYATSSRLSDQVNLAGVFLRSMHPPILYEVAIGAHKDGKAAHRLHAFLLSKTARGMYHKLGFILQ